MPRNDDLREAETSPDGRYVRFDEKLGNGAYKDVYLSYDTETGKEVAWNTVNLSRLPQTEIDRISSETDILGKLSHPHIITFYQVWRNDSKEQICFTTEIVTSGTLKQYTSRVKAIKLKVIKKWCRQILNALNYLHSHTPPIIHRDLKLDNIFINGSTGEIRIGDFGLSATRHTTHVESVLGTPEFMAPELYDENYSELVDIYAFGMCLLEMATKEYPYEECTNAAQIWKRVSQGQKPAVLLRIKDQQVKSFIELCLNAQEMRLSAHELLQHPFLAFKRSDPGRADAVAHVEMKAGTPLPQATTTHKQQVAAAAAAQQQQQQQNNNNNNNNNAGAFSAGSPLMLARKPDLSPSAVHSDPFQLSSLPHSPRHVIQSAPVLNPPNPIASSSHLLGTPPSNPSSSPLLSSDVPSSMSSIDESRSVPVPRKSTVMFPIPHNPELKIETEYSSSSSGTNPIIPVPILISSSGQQLFSVPPATQPVAAVASFPGVTPFSLPPSSAPPRSAAQSTSIPVSVPSTPFPAVPSSFSSSPSSVPAVCSPSDPNSVASVVVDIDNYNGTSHSTPVVLNIHFDDRRVKQVKFDFDFRSDTSMSVAGEMSKAFQLPDSERTAMLIATTMEAKLDGIRRNYFESCRKQNESPITHNNNTNNVNTITQQTTTTQSNTTVTASSTPHEPVDPNQSFNSLVESLMMDAAASTPIVHSRSLPVDHLSAPSSAVPSPAVQSGDQSFESILNNFSSPRITAHATTNPVPSLARPSSVPAVSLSAKTSPHPLEKNAQEREKRKQSIEGSHQSELSSSSVVDDSTHHSRWSSCYKQLSVAALKQKLKERGGEAIVSTCFDKNDLVEALIKLTEKEEIPPQNNEEGEKSRSASPSFTPTTAPVNQMNNSSIGTTHGVSISPPQKTRQERDVSLPLHSTDAFSSLLDHHGSSSSPHTNTAPPTVFVPPSSSSSDPFAHLGVSSPDLLLHRPLSEILPRHMSSPSPSDGGSAHSAPDQGFDFSSSRKEFSDLDPLGALDTNTEMPSTHMRSPSSFFKQATNELFHPDPNQINGQTENQSAQSQSTSSSAKSLPPPLIRRHSRSATVHPSIFDSVSSSTLSDPLSAPAVSSFIQNQTLQEASGTSNSLPSMLPSNSFSSSLSSAIPSVSSSPLPPSSSTPMAASSFAGHLYDSKKTGLEFDFLSADLAAAVLSQTEKEKTQENNRRAGHSRSYSSADLLKGSQLGAIQEKGQSAQGNGSSGGVLFLSHSGIGGAMAAHSHNRPNPGSIGIQEEDEGEEELNEVGGGGMRRTLSSNSLSSPSPLITAAPSSTPVGISMLADLQTEPVNKLLGDFAL